MDNAAVLDRQYRQRKYIETLRQCHDEGAAKQAAGLTDETYRKYRSRYPEFKALDDKILPRSKRKKAKKKAKNGRGREKQPLAAPPLEIAPQPLPDPIPTPTPEPEIKVTEQPTISRREFDAKVQQYRLEIVGRLKAKDIYHESDETQIMIVAKELATLERYEAIRFSPDYQIMCPVRTTALLELNPLESIYWATLKQVTRHLQALGLNHDAKDFGPKKKKGTIDKDELNLSYGSGEPKLIKAVES